MESKTYVFNPESGTSGTGSNGILAMLPALMQRQGVDPGLIALLNNRGNGNGWGEDIFAILLLFILMGNNGMGLFGGNRCMGSNGQGGVMPMLNNDANTAVIMQAVQRNGFDVQSGMDELEMIRKKIAASKEKQENCKQEYEACI